jgi:predicted nucleic acid-binding protein
MQVGVELAQAPEWTKHVIDAGRDAAFVDTGYLRALLDDSDESHDVVRDHWQSARAVFYTSSLVLSETVRWVAKTGTRDQFWSRNTVTQAKALVVDDQLLLVCAPPRDIVHTAMNELVEMQENLPRLDLCDTLSMVILKLLEHRRVLSFDNHFRAIGATLEPVG